MINYANYNYPRGVLRTNVLIEWITKLSQNMYIKITSFTNLKDELSN